MEGEERRHLACAVLVGDADRAKALLQRRGFLESSGSGSRSGPDPGSRPGSPRPTLGGPDDIGERYEAMCDAPLHAACRAGDAALARLLLAAGASTRAANTDGATPLHVAAGLGRAEAAAALLEAGADPQAVDADGAAPLHHAAQGGHSDCAQLLLSAGAAADPRDDAELTPLHCAAAAGHAAACRCLLRAEPRTMELHDGTLDTPVAAAVRNGHCSVVDEFLAAGLDVNGLDAFGTSLLQLAAFHGLAVAVQHLLINDAAVDSGGGKANLSALHLAALGGHGVCVGYLLEAKADPNTTGGLSDDGRGERRTPLHSAAASGHRDVVVQLLRAGSHATAKDYQRHTPRELAALESHKATTKVLDDHAAGIDPDAAASPKLRALSRPGTGVSLPRRGGKPSHPEKEIHN